MRGMKTLALAAAAAALAAGPAAAQTVKIGLILTYSGPQASLGRHLVNQMLHGLAQVRVDQENTLIRLCHCDRQVTCNRRFAVSW